MIVDRIIKGIVWGVSTAIGLVVAESIYRASTSKIDERKLIGDCEIISDRFDDVEDI